MWTILISSMEIKWLKLEDAPIEYFFAQLKAKYTRETIRALNIANDRVTKLEVQMKSVIQNYYKELYEADSKVAGNREEREEILHLTDRKVSNADNRRICSMPTMKEVKQVVLGFETNTSPALDGVMADVTKECWEFVRDMCVAAV